MHFNSARRNFLKQSAWGSAALFAATAGTRADDAPDAKILGEAGVETRERSAKKWTPVSDRRIRVGIAGYGVCRFGAAFGFQDHPNVEIVAVTDLIPENCAELARVCRCKTTYPSFDEMLKDERLEAVFIATDAPSHAEHTIAAMKRGLHVACAVPAVFGSVDDAHRVREAVRASGTTYMMFETSAFHQDCLSMRRIYEAGGFGELVYSEGEYYHYMAEPIASFRDWRVGLPPQWYPTHSNAYQLCVTGGHFTEVSCMGMPSTIDHLKPENNRYENPFGTEVALFRTSQQGMSRMAVSWDTPGLEGEVGRIRGQRGSMAGTQYVGQEQQLPNLEFPALPPTVAPGGHGGSHGHLMNEFVLSILEQRTPLVDISTALHLTVAGIVAHDSAMKNGETLKIPTFT